MPSVTILGAGVLAIPVTSDGGWVQIDRDGDGIAELVRIAPAPNCGCSRSTPASGGSIKLLGQIQHDAEVRRSVRIEDLLYSISQQSVKVTSDPGPQAPIGLAVFWAGEGRSSRVRGRFSGCLASVSRSTSPERAAPQVVDVNVGSTTWAREFVNHLESQATSDDALVPMEIVPYGASIRSRSPLARTCWSA